jgi:hypothetical protein
MYQPNKYGFSPYQAEKRQDVGTNLCTYVHTSTPEITNRVIPPMMTKFHFECLPTKSLPNQLVAHTDAKHRNLPNDFFYCLHSIGDRSWISRTIAKKNTIRLHLKYLGSRPIRWNNSYLASI